MSYKARTALAVRIARVDRDRFNEAVADGFYGCAPSTARGSARVFDEADMIALFCYGRMIDEGMSPRSAGSIACGVLEHVRNTDAAAAEGLSKPAPSVSRAVGIGNGKATFVNRDDRFAPSLRGVGDVAMEIRFNIAAVRAHVRKELDEEKQILGDED